MRAVKNSLLILLTLALVAAGALLPYGTAGMQDRRLENDHDTRELSQVQLLIQQDMSAAQVLKLLGGDYTRMAWDSETNLTALDAMDYAYDCVNMMILERLLPASAIDASPGTGEWWFDEQDGTANAFLVISNGEALLLWECTWEISDESGEVAVYTVWIDDATGTMYGFNRTNQGGYVDVEITAIPKELYIYADMWASFLGYYYELEVVNTDIRIKVASDNESWDTFVLNLGYENTGNGALETCTVQIKLQGENISFIC